MCDFVHEKEVYLKNTLQGIERVGLFLKVILSGNVGMYASSLVLRVINNCLLQEIEINKKTKSEKIRLALARLDVIERQIKTSVL